MTTRITKSRDPILAALKAEHMAALESTRTAVTILDWDVAFYRAQDTRKAMDARADVFRPKRVRKAERKARHFAYIVAYVTAQPVGFRNHVPATALAISEASRAGSYRDHLILWRGFIYPGDDDRKENVAAHREALQWARFHRLVAAECGRRLP